MYKLGEEVGEMMLKVFLVEDEVAVRERMKKNINWAENGFCLVGEAGDGELAYPLIQEVKPDIIITDIKMPFMDGLELSKLVKKDLPQVKIIILSGYDEFEYAKEAINIGVIDYLLKPITSKKLMESLNQVAQVIRKEQEKQAYYERCQLERLESMQLASKKFFYNMVTGKLSATELIAQAKSLAIDLTAKMYNVVLIKGSVDLKAKEENLPIGRITDRLQAWMQERVDVIGFDRETEGWALILKGTNTHIEELEKEIITLIQEEMKDYPMPSYCIGIGHRASRLSEIAYAFETANQALAYRYMLQNEKVIYYDTLKQYKLSQKDKAISIREMDLIHMDKKTIEDFLRSGTKQQLQDFIVNYIKSIQGGMESFLFRQYIMMDIYFNVIAFGEQLGYEKDEVLKACGDIKEIYTVIQSKEDASHYLEILLTGALSLRDAMSGRRYKALVEDAKYYIKKYYNKESISLNQVADYVNMSSSHFSAVFSQETGQTFISYLTQIRMEKAKELLRCSSMKTLEVGYEVGYKDPHYFSHLFKKTQNCTPKEYRKSTLS